MAETNETCIGNIITKSAWLCQRTEGRFGKDICIRQSGHWDVHLYFTCSTLPHLEVTGSTACADGGRVARTGCHSQVMACSLMKYGVRSIKDAVWVCLGHRVLRLIQQRISSKTTAGGLDKRLVNAVWVVNNSHLPLVARGCQSNNSAQTTIHT